MLHVFRSKKYYYLIYDRTVEVKDFSFNKTIIKLKLSNIIVIFNKENIIYLVNTTSKIFQFDEDNLILDDFMKVKTSLIQKIFFSISLNSIIVFCFTKGANRAIYKINIDTKLVEDVKLPKSFYHDIYYYDDNKLEILKQDDTDSKNYEIVSYDLNTLKKISTRNIQLFGCDTFASNRYQFGFDYSKSKSFFGKRFNIVYDKVKDKFIDLQANNINMMVVVYFYDYGNYFYLSDGFISYITDSNFNILKKYDAHLSDRYDSVVPDIYIEDKYVIYRLSHGKYQILNKSEFFSKKVIDCEIDEGFTIISFL